MNTAMDIPATSSTTVPMTNRERRMFAADRTWTDPQEFLAQMVADDMWGEVPHSFDAMDDLVDYTLRRDGMVTARKVA